MNDKTAIEKAREALKEIANQEVGTWDKPVPFSVLYRRSVDIAREALAALDAEKPADDARDVAQNIIGMALSDYSGLDRLLENDTCIAIEMIQSFTASYHAEQCKACKANATIDNRICGLCGKYTTCSMPFVECCGKHWQPFPEDPLV